VESRGTILVVDDEQANLDSLDRIFAREGYRILLARSGEEAVETLRAQAVDVVLTDLMMPSMSGQELLRAVRAVAPDAEVVLMTAYGTVEAAVAAMRPPTSSLLASAATCSITVSSWSPSIAISGSSR